MPLSLLLVPLFLAPSAAKPVIINMHQQYAIALVAKDYVSLERMMERYVSRKLVWTRKSGQKMTYTDMVANNRKDMAAKKAGKADGPLAYQPILSNWQIGATKVVVDVNVRGRGEWLQNGRRLPVVFHQFMEETWVLESGAWKLRKMRELKVEGTVDGKKMTG